MLSKCKYADLLKCTQCTCAFHIQCKKFIVARAKVLTKELGNFIYNSKVKIAFNVVWTNNENKAKSAALRYALKYNARVKRYSMSQIISIALSNEIIEEKVIYIDYNTKLQGDIEKIKGVLCSFIETSLLRGTKVVVYIAPTITVKLDYDKV